MIWNEDSVQEIPINMLIGGTLAQMYLKERELDNYPIETIASLLISALKVTEDYHKEIIE